MDSKEEQPQNASSPIEVTLSGITIDFKEEQYVNALSPIEVTPSGIIILPEAFIEQLKRTPPTIVRYSFIYLSGYKLVSIYELKIVKFYHPTFHIHRLQDIRNCNHCNDKVSASLLHYQMSLHI
jgi:hypothetical protein